MSEQRALRHLTAELQMLEHLKQLQASRAYQVIRAGGRAIHCFVTAELLAEQQDLVAEAKTALQAARDLS